MPNLGLYATTSVRVAALEFRDVAAVCRVASVSPSTHGGRVASPSLLQYLGTRPRRRVASFHASHTAALWLVSSFKNRLDRHWNNENVKFDWTAALESGAVVCF